MELDHLWLTVVDSAACDELVLWGLRWVSSHFRSASMGAVLKQGLFEVLSYIICRFDET